MKGAVSTYTPRQKALETQLVLHVLMEPELSRCVPERMLSPLPELLVECVALAPTFCREIGVAFHVANCLTHSANDDYDALVDYIKWLGKIPNDLVTSLPPFEDVLESLESPSQRRAA